MILAIVGSRELTTKQQLTGQWLVNTVISNYIYLYRDELKVISGGATGIDSYVEEVMELRGKSWQFEAYTPKKRVWPGPNGFQARNTRLATDSDHLFCIQARYAETYGSGWTFDEAIRRGKIEGETAWRVFL